LIEEDKSSTWKDVLELSTTDVTVNSTLRVYRDEPREKQLIRMVCALTSQKHEMHELLVKKKMTESATMRIEGEGNCLRLVKQLAEMREVFKNYVSQDAWENGHRELTGEEASEYINELIDAERAKTKEKS
jgi:hypothetical protein